MSVYLPMTNSRNVAKFQTDQSRNGKENFEEKNAD